MTLDKVSILIKTTLKKDGVEITENTDLIMDVGLNSFEVAELVCAFEDEFDVVIPDRDIGKFRIVGDIVAYLDGKAKE